MYSICVYIYIYIHTYIYIYILLSSGFRTLTCYETP